MNVLADTHCHLVWDTFRADLSDTIASATREGVRAILVPGIDLETSRQAVELARQHASVFAAVGIHPHEASGWNADTAAALRELSQAPKVVAIGEIGLDFYRNHSTPQSQHAAFSAQLELAAEVDLPVVVHSREAMDAVLDLLLPWSSSLSPERAQQAGVLHAFSGDYQSAARAISGGFHIGIAGPLTYPKSAELRDLVARLPEDRIIIETDAPFLTPHPYRGKRNEPGFVRFVALELSRVKGRDLSWAAAATSRNAKTLFGWDYGN